MPTNGELQRVGEIAVWFANIELYVEVGIWQLASTSGDPVRRFLEAITAEMSFDRKVHAFASVYRLRFPSEADDVEFLEIIKDLFSAQDERNAILHSAWSVSVIDRSLVRVKSSAKARHGLKRRAYAMSEMRLAEISGKMSDTGHRFAEFCRTRIEARASD